MVLGYFKEFGCFLLIDELQLHNFLHQFLCFSLRFAALSILVAASIFLDDFEANVVLFSHEVFRVADVFHHYALENRYFCCTVSHHQVKNPTLALYFLQSYVDLVFGRSHSIFKLPQWKICYFRQLIIVLVIHFFGIGVSLENILTFNARVAGITSFWDGLLIFFILHCWLLKCIKDVFGALLTGLEDIRVAYLK